MMYRLCGGTFFTLLTAVKRPNSRKKILILGAESTTSEKWMFTSLMRILNPAYRPNNPQNLGVTASEFKNCRRSYGTDLPLNDSSYTCGFHQRLRDNPQLVFQQMYDFCHAYFLIEDPERIDWLVRALMELILTDGCIPDTACFIIRENFPPIKKTALASEERIDLPVFLTGVLDYIVMHVPDNTVGLETLNDLVMKKENKYQVSCPAQAFGSQISHPMDIRCIQPEAPMPPSLLREYANPPASCGQDPSSSEPDNQTPGGTAAGSRTSFCPCCSTADTSPDELHSLVSMLLNHPGQADDLKLSKTQLQTICEALCILMLLYYHSFCLSRKELEFSIHTAMAHEEIQKPDCTPDQIIQFLCGVGILTPKDSHSWNWLQPDLPAYFCASYCLRHSDRILQKICAWLEKTSHPASAVILSMLYDRAPDRMELFVFLPFLSGIFSQSDSDACYWTYLKRCIGSISSYHYLPFLYPQTAAADAGLLRLIRKRLHLAKTVFKKIRISHRPEFVLTSYKQFQGIHSRFLCGKKDAETAVFLSKLCELKEMRYDYRYDLSRIAQKKENYPDLVRLLTDPDGPLQKEYQQLRSYYDLVREKKERWNRIHEILS